MRKKKNKGIILENPKAAWKKQQFKLFFPLETAISRKFSNWNNFSRSNGETSPVYEIPFYPLENGELNPNNSDKIVVCKWWR
ncbi:hypothetical protein CEXT_218021 [Caerostris extrusa]|uniref:Uncharacterized protein n=1 Tax=Caerostris extrusa TaxID=172846 RepID=A0AAV4TYS7_CAEEX|nr:hypothetical protein CEXT_218021 [Caerostris extrusa]